METKTPRSRAPLRSLPLAGALTLLLTACGPVEPTEQEAGRTKRTGLLLTLRLDEYSDVTAIHFSLERRSCVDEVIVPYTLDFKRELEEIRLPGGIPDFEDEPFDRDSSHAFADLFVTLPEGCYDITTFPLAADGGPSMDCSPAATWNTEVVNGQTTELLLINQCWAREERGAIDVIAGLNHPPELIAVNFDPSRFVHQCIDQVVCATAWDADEDPLEFSWTQVSGPAALFESPKEVSTTRNDDGSVTQCVRMVAETPGGYGMKLVVYDLLPDSAHGEQMRIQDYLAHSGNLYPSNDSLSFPFYAARDGREGGCTEAATSCKTLLEREPGLPSGLYTLDPDGAEGALEPYLAWCDMSTHGGGWTLVMVSSDDDQDTWTWSSRALMTTHALSVGDVHERNRDFKSPALHQVAFTDLLFVHAPSSQWAAYASVGNGSTDLGHFMAGLAAPACDPSLGGNGYPLSAGTISTQGWLCDTDLYFHLGDLDGTADTNYCKGNSGFQDSTYGPAWNISFNHACPFDEPAYASTGPALNYPTFETPSIGFGEALGLNTGEPGMAQNYLQMYVR